MNARPRAPLDWLRRVVSHPVVEVCAGLVMAAASIWVLLELPAAIDEGERGQAAYVGLLALAAFVVLRSLALLAESVELLAEGTRHIGASRGGRPARILGSIARHPAFEFSAAAVLVLAGAVEAWEAWHEPELQAGAAWCLGLIVVGLTMLGRSLFGLVEGAGFFAHGERHRGRRVPVLHRFFGTLRQPAFEVSVGLLVIGLVVFEWVWIESPMESAEASMAAETSFLLFGVARVLRFAPHLYSALEVIGDAGSTTTQHSKVSSRGESAGGD
jgi:hypothetical protein